jgi:hypothetical protein
MVERGGFEPPRPFISPSFRDLTGVSILWRELASGQKTEKIFPSCPFASSLVRAAAEDRPKVATSDCPSEPFSASTVAGPGRMV